VGRSVGSVLGSGVGTRRSYVGSSVGSSVGALLGEALGLGVGAATLTNVTVWVQPSLICFEEHEVVTTLLRVTSTVPLDTVEATAVTTVPAVTPVEEVTESPTAMDDTTDDETLILVELADVKNTDATTVCAIV